jgi:hypothetical protein
MIDYVNKDAEKKLEDIIKIQCSTGNWDYDPYMHGLANGLLLAQATIFNKRFEPKQTPKKYKKGIDKYNKSVIITS